MNDTYRKTFAEPARAEEYDRVDFRPHSYGSLLWEMEKQMLEEVVTELRETHDQVDYLDFASGTGRILSFVENIVDTATGIEVSEAMAARAREKVTKATVLRKDITVDGAEVEGKYDFITTFRFVLNAEPSLQLAGLRALAARLRDGSSRLVFNNHSNIFSHKILMLPYHKLRRIGKGHVPYGLYLSDGQVRRLADQAGLQIERVKGMGLLSGTLCKAIPFNTALRWEKKLAQVGMLQSIGCNQLYVAKLKD